jgi:hypothetical protein
MGASGASIATSLEAMLRRPIFEGARFYVEIHEEVEPGRLVVLVRADRGVLAEYQGVITELLRYAEPDWRPLGYLASYRFMATDALCA